MTSTIITIHDILESVPVSDRTIRNWIAKGLVPRPVKKSLGYRRGVIGIYPQGSIEAARIAYATNLPLEERIRLVTSSPESYDYEMELDGTIVLKIPAKKAW